MKKVFFESLVWSAIAVFSVAVAIAQEGGPAAPAAGQRTDGQIEMDVVQALDASQALKNDLITAATIQGHVTLSGTVASAAESELAASISGHVNGVSKVNNNLKVGNPQEAQDAPAPAAEDDVPMAGSNQPGNNQSAPGAGQGQPADQGQPQVGINQPAPDQGQAPPPPAQPQYPGYPPARPPYYAQQQAPPPPPAPSYEYPKGPVTLPEGTLLQLRTSEEVDTKHATNGTPIQFTVIRDVTLGGVLAIPRGATLHGVVTEVKRVDSGSLGGSSELALTLNSLDLGGQNYPINSDQFKVKGPNKAGRTASNAIGGALLGAIIGGIAGRGEGAAIGAGAGAAAGTVASAATPGPNVWIPAEALVVFHLKAPITVQPVSAQEAARLAQGLYPGGPTLYRRYPYGYPAYGYAGYPYYAYPPVYYRPYYVVGGAYYWR
jgi:BON domain